MVDCLFCKIIAGEISSTKVYEDDEIFAFEDIHPQAPVHVLLLPKRHLSTLNEMEASDRPLMGHLLHAATQIAAERGTAEAGYRTIINVNSGGGQSVFHVHLHLLGGRPLKPGLG